MPKQLVNKHAFEYVQSDPNILINTIMRDLKKIRIQYDIYNDAHQYFLIKDPKFAMFYLLPKIHKRLHYDPGILFTFSNYGFYREIIFPLLHHHLPPIAKKVDSFIKDTNDYLSKIKNSTSGKSQFLDC